MLRSKSGRKHVICLFAKSFNFHASQNFLSGSFLCLVIFCSRGFSLIIEDCDLHFGPDFLIARLFFRIWIGGKFVSVLLPNRSFRWRWFSGLLFQLCFQEQEIRRHHPIDLFVYSLRYLHNFEFYTSFCSGDWVGNVFRPDWAVLIV